MRHVRLLHAVGSLLLAAPLAAQRAHWVVTAAPAANLWYHALALSGAEGFGAFPLYDPGYAGTVVRVRRPRELPPTPLELSPPTLVPALAADSALELVHFLPLWFPAATPSELLDLVAAPERSPAGRLLTGALPAPESRRVLTGLAEALRREWRGGYPALLDALLPPTRVAEVTAAWAPVAADLAPYLEAHALGGGVVMLVPALGPDGRFFGGDPANPADNVVAVALGPDEPATAAVYRLVRELCYPVVRVTLAGRLEPADRVAGERLSGAAAVRCGHTLLARYRPADVAGYDALWLGGAATAGDITRAFALPPAVETALSRRLALR